ncbi:MAG: hypothetical protein ABFC57_18390, partial [Veillonellales bacterium]
MKPWRVIYLGRNLVRRVLLFILGLTALVHGGPTVVMAASLLVSLAVYALAFGMNFAVGFVILLFIHEAGHIGASRAVGVPASGPVFLPFIGAAMSLEREPVNARMEANIAIGGPAAGTLSALVCLAVYFWTDSILMLVLAYTAGLLNLFNLIPCDPLDGGRIAGAISPHMWWVGSIAIGLLFLYTGNFFILLVFLFSLFRLWQGEERENAYYYRLTAEQRLTVLWWYLGLLLVLGATTLYIAEIIR